MQAADRDTSLDSVEPKRSASAKKTPPRKFRGGEGDSDDEAMCLAEEEHAAGHAHGPAVAHNVAGSLYGRVFDFFWSRGRGGR